MLSSLRGDAASPEIASLGQVIRKRVDPAVESRSSSRTIHNTFIVRLGKGARVLIFRLSASQVHTDGREAECERTLLRKIKDLWNLI